MATGKPTGKPTGTSGPFVVALEDLSNVTVNPAQVAANIKRIKETTAAFLNNGRESLDLSPQPLGSDSPANTHVG